MLGGKANRAMGLHFALGCIAHHTFLVVLVRGIHRSTYSLLKTCLHSPLQLVDKDEMTLGE